MSIAGSAQVVGNYAVLYVFTAPSGTCASTALQEDVIGAGTIYTCQSGTWGQVSGSSVVPNTPPSAGQLLVGNAGGTAYAPVSLSGDCTLASTGAITCTKTSGSSFATVATSGSASDLGSGTLAVARGGTGTSSTLTGLVRGNASAMTAAELSGDVTTSGSNAATVVKVNGAAVPTSAITVGTNASQQLVAYTPLTMLVTTGSGTATVAGSTTSFLIPFGGYGLGAAEVTREVALPVSGTIGNLTVCISTAQPTGGGLTITYRMGPYNGTMVSQALSVAIATSAGIGCYQDTTAAHAFAYTAGQALSIQAVNASGSTSANISSISATFQ